MPTSVENALPAKPVGDRRIKIPIVAVVSLNGTCWPIHAKITAVAGFSSEAIVAWATQHLAPGCEVLSDGLACFSSVTNGGCRHEVIVTGVTHPKDLQQFRWIITLLENLKTSLTGTFNAFYFDKYARRYLGGYCYRFNRHFAMAYMTERISNAACSSMSSTERDLRVAEIYG